MAYLESHVPTKTFHQISRVVKNLMSPAQVSGGNTMAGIIHGFGQIEITGAQLSAGFGNDFGTIKDIFLWNPTGDGRGNLHHIATAGYDHPLNTLYGNGMWNFLPGPVTAATHGRDDPVDARTIACANYINTPILDPDVRALYPKSSCRTTDAKCVLDVDMGGGNCTIRAVKFTKEMSSYTPQQLHAHILADRHSTHVFDVGKDGKQAKRIIFPKWVQSRKAVGEFTASRVWNSIAQSVDGAGAVNPISHGATGMPGDAETLGNGMSALYTDEFPYGGWAFMFENIAPKPVGTVPWMRWVSVVEIQVQLSLAENHLRETGPCKSLSSHINSLMASPSTSKPSTKIMDDAPVKEAMNMKGGNGGNAKPFRDTVDRQMVALGRRGKNGPRKSAAPKRAVRAPRPTGLRGAQPKQVQAQMSAQASRARNPQVIAKQVQDAAALYRKITGLKKAQTPGLGNGLMHALSGMRPGPRKYAIQNGNVKEL